MLQPCLALVSCWYETEEREYGYLTLKPDRYEFSPGTTSSLWVQIRHDSNWNWAKDRKGHDSLGTCQYTVDSCIGKWEKTQSFMKFNTDYIGALALLCVVEYFDRCRARDKRMQVESRIRIWRWRPVNCETRLRSTTSTVILHLFEFRCSGSSDWCLTHEGNSICVYHITS